MTPNPEVRIPDELCTSAFCGLATPGLGSTVRLKMFTNSPRNLEIHPLLDPEVAADAGVLRRMPRTAKVLIQNIGRRSDLVGA